jgi:hypothetical protein
MRCNKVTARHGKASCAMLASISTRYFKPDWRYFALQVSSVSCGSPDCDAVQDGVPYRRCGSYDQVYCSRACQTAHWTTPAAGHKAHCTRVAVADGGRASVQSKRAERVAAVVRNAIEAKLQALQYSWCAVRRDKVPTPRVLWLSFNTVPCRIELLTVADALASIAAEDIPIEDSGGWDVLEIGGARVATERARACA